MCIRDSGYLFAWVLIGADPGPPKWPASYRLLMLFATIGFHAFFGVALTGSSTLLVPSFFEPLNIPWIPNPLDDQHQAGAIAWGVGEVPSLFLAPVSYTHLDVYKRQPQGRSTMRRQSTRSASTSSARRSGSAG